MESQSVQHPPCKGGGTSWHDRHPALQEEEEELDHLIVAFSPPALQRSHCPRWASSCSESRSSLVETSQLQRWAPRPVALLKEFMVEPKRPRVLLAGLTWSHFHSLDLIATHSAVP